VLTVHAVLPADVADPALVSGGNRYDRAVLRELAARDWTVRPVPVAGAWPRPAAPESAALAGALAAIPDGSLVLADGLVVCGAPDAVLPAAARLRLVVLVHMPLADDPALRPATARALDAAEGAVLRAATAVIATSTPAAQRLADRHRLSPGRVHAVPPGVDPAPLAPGTDGSSALLCVAALSRTKGQDVLIDALAAVADLRWTCTLAGSVRREPTTARAIRDRVAELGLTDRIRLVGPQADIAPWYAAADLLVHPSRTETYGMVVTEALARGLPVLTTTAGALPQTLTPNPTPARSLAAGSPAAGSLGHDPGSPGATPAAGSPGAGTGAGGLGAAGMPGLLVPPENAPALAAALRRWLTEPDLRTELRAAAQQRRPTLVPWPDRAAELARVLESTPEPAR
jgi:glycosyltransferase involved in cell wall biosynthesis